MAPSGPSLRSAHSSVAQCFASPASHTTRACDTVGPFASLVTWRRRALRRVSGDANGVCLGSVGPSLRSSHDVVAHCVASLASQTTFVCGVVDPFASLVTWQRRSLLRFSCVANGVCLWRRRSLRFARHMTASPIASLFLRCKRRVPVAPSVPSLRSSHDGVAHCFASPASQTTRACGAVDPFASLVIWQRRSLQRFSCVANDVCLWRRQSLRFARHMTTSRITTRLL